MYFRFSIAAIAIICDIANGPLSCCTLSFPEKRQVDAVLQSFGAEFRLVIQG